MEENSRQDLAEEERFAVKTKETSGEKNSRYDLTEKKDHHLRQENQGQKTNQSKS